MIQEDKLGVEEKLKILTGTNMALFLGLLGPK
jgi:hypothetical protein